MSSQARLVLVVGVGRSGTSLLAGILAQLGFHIPQPEVNADETNPRGFGEPRWVVDFHSRLMRERRVTVFDARPAAWEKTNAAAADHVVVGELGRWLGGQLESPAPVVVKDPRISWFLPLWMQCAGDLGAPAGFVTMLRHPAEILTSARRWYGTWQTDASRAASWLNVMLETEAATRGRPRVYVHHPELLAGWAPQMRRVGAALELPALSALEPSQHPDVEDFIDPSLHRSRTGWDELAVPAAVRDMAEDVWALFERTAQEGGDAPALHAELDAARAAYADLYADAEAIAQSSVTAVKPRRKPAPAPPPPGLRGVYVRIARRIPARHRRRVRRLIASARAR
jgi:hypothetical protein